jgi:ankyrin repeat protein
MGVTPLHLSMLRKYSFELIELLLKNGADPNLAADELYDVEWDNDLTPLHLAASIGDLKIVTLLVSYGADRNKTTRNNKKASDIYQEAFGNEEHDRTSDEAQAEFDAAIEEGVKLGEQRKKEELAKNIANPTTLDSNKATSTSDELDKAVIDAKKQEHVAVASDEKTTMNAAGRYSCSVTSASLVNMLAASKEQKIIDQF